MNIKCLFAIIAAQLLSLNNWTTLGVPTQSSDEYLYDAYQIVSERNIFSRNRIASRQVDDSDKSRQQKIVVLSLYVLKGVAVNGPQKVAFIEEEVSGESMKAKIGTQIMNGTIKEIENNYVLFEENNQIRKIIIGELFGKSESVKFESLDTDQSTPSPQSPEDEEVVPSDQDDILKRLLERRKNELGT